MSSRHPVRIALPLVMLLASTGHAGDEDMSPSAYHVFDPETGYMVTVDPMAEEQPEPIAEDVAPTEDAAALVRDEPAAPVPWGYWVSLIVAIGGLIVWLHHRRERE